jgi:hypothetical protein
MLRRLLLSIFAFSIIAVAGEIGYRTWPRKLNFPLLVVPRSPICTYAGHRLVLRSPSGALAAEVGRFREELRAYLRFEYLASRTVTKDHPVLLTVSWNCTGPVYRVRVLLPNDLLTAVPYIERLRALGYIPGFRLESPSRPQVTYAERQTKLFETAYNSPVRHKLKDLSPSEVRQPLARFLVFKSQTDRRVREEIEPVPAALSIQQARQLAGDIISVAQFYDLPVDVLVGVGAMENDFMNMNGDLQHAVWKRRAAEGDIVVKRWRRRVLVCDSSVGVWQLTRETRQYAQSLYLRDRTKRDYTSLPPRLRPPLELSEYVGDNREVLTTYAALLLRHLVDQFHGNLGRAVGAYNGGPKHPNSDYAGDVETIADYARRIIEHAVAFDDEAVHPSVWRAPPPEAPMLDAQIAPAQGTLSTPRDFPEALSYSVGVTPRARLIPQLQGPELPRQLLSSASVAGR